LAGLEGGVRGDLGHDGGRDLSERHGLACVGPAADADLVGPRVIPGGGFEHGAQVGGLLGRQWDGAADLDQLVAAIPASYDRLRAADGSEDGADDDLDGVAVLDLFRGFDFVSCTVALGWVFDRCTTLA
jgi:hypothetical protein